MLFREIMKQSVQQLSVLIISASPRRPLAASQCVFVGVCVSVETISGRKMSWQQTSNYERMESFGLPVLSLKAGLMKR